jgi:tRNA threonylcarbamoyladenosine biosynthesis protein TsaB
MLSAAFETSTRRPTVALQVGSEVFEERLSGERPHASDLLPALDRLLSSHGKRVRDLELIVVGTGPGSFTGLRVAVATALGLARGGDASLFGVPSGEALCWRELAVGEAAAVVLDARQGELYFAHYQRALDGVRVVHAPSVIAPADLPALLTSGPRIFGEPGIELAASLDSAARARLCVDRSPTASALLELGVLRHGREGAHSAAQLEPLYLRAFGSSATARARNRTDTRC